MNTNLVCNLASNIQYAVKIDIWKVIMVYYLVIHEGQAAVPTQERHGGLRVQSADTREKLRSVQK